MEATKRLLFQKGPGRKIAATPGTRRRAQEVAEKPEGHPGHRRATQRAAVVGSCYSGSGGSIGEEGKCFQRPDVSWVHAEDAARDKTETSERREEVPAPPLFLRSRLLRVSSLARSQRKPADQEAQGTGQPLRLRARAGRTLQIRGQRPSGEQASGRWGQGRMRDSHRRTMGNTDFRTKCDYLQATC